MSDLFTLPTSVKKATIAADDKYKATFFDRPMTPPSTAGTTHEQDKAITHAINNHDALVKYLSEMVAMMDCGDEHGSGGEWHDEASTLLNKIASKDLK